MVPGLGLNAQHFGRIRMRRRGETPSALARVHLTVRCLSYRTKKAPALTEASLNYGARSWTKCVAFRAHSLCEGGVQPRAL